MMEAKSTKALQGTSLVVQWWGLRAFTAKGPGSIPGRGARIPQAALCGPKKQTKKTSQLSLPPLGHLPWGKPAAMLSGCSRSRVERSTW